MTRFIWHWALRGILLVTLGGIGHAEASLRVVRVGVFQAPPLVFVENGKPSGLFIDLVEEFARSAGWKVQYVEKPWPDQLLALENGAIDLLPAIGFTKERQSRFEFSRDPVFIDSGILFVGPRLVVHTLFDLEGKKVATLRNSIFTKAFQENLASFGIRCDLVLTDDNKQVMEALASGRVDAGVTIYSLGNYLAPHYPVSITPISFSPIALQFAVPRGQDADLLAVVNRQMAAMRGDSESVYSRSYRKWTLPPDVGGFLPWLLWGLVSLGGVALVPPPSGGVAASG